MVAGGEGGERGGERAVKVRLEWMRSYLVFATIGLLQACSSDVAGPPLSGHLLERPPSNQNARIEALCHGKVFVKPGARGGEVKDARDLCLMEFNAVEISTVNDVEKLDGKSVIHVRRIDPSGFFSSAPGVSCFDLPAENRIYIAIAGAQEDVLRVIERRNSNLANNVYKKFCQKLGN